VESLPRILGPLAVPAAILLAFALALAAGPLPSSLSGLIAVGPYIVLLLGVAISAWFNRGRALIMLLSLLVAYAGYRLAADLGAKSFAVRAVFTALAVLVPLNVLLATYLPDGGVRQHRNYRWLLLGLAEVLIVIWIANAGRSSLSGTAWRDVLDHWLLRSPPTPPPVARVMIALAFAGALVRAWPRRGPKELRKEPRPVDVGIASALVAFFLACEWAEVPGAFSAFMSAAGVMLLAAVLQESHRLAFRDELTNLPSRRALEERLAGLGPRYAIAMIDVDHFKQFNDAHGHHVGDQVLKLVAARLAKIEGGGVSYRYGGEEFCVLFPDRTLEEALPHLERLRKDIEDYRIAVRGGDRPREREAGSRLRAARPPEKTLSVTVSIGAAERDDTLIRPALVIRAADEALYRAKRSGRNRVTR
jgi:diguanylate cyclase (GGDEF)-like protein